MSLIVNIDPDSGFCFGVVKAIEAAERELSAGSEVWSIGQIVHNKHESERLKALGMKETNLQQLETVRSGKVLIRAHGEPPSTYSTAHSMQLEVVDATCPLVLKLQQQVKSASRAMEAVGGTVIIFGKQQHPEVAGLLGHAGHCAVVVESDSDLALLNFSAPIRLFSQTTIDNDDYSRMTAIIKKQCDIHGQADFQAARTVCRQVSSRKESLLTFAKKHELVLFVSGRNSSNGKALFEHCRSAHPNTHFVEGVPDLRPEWFQDVKTIGISGATSTPPWLLKQVADAITRLTTTPCI